MWEIRREDLIKGLEVLALVPEKLGIPASEFFWVRGEGNKVTMSVASYISGEIELKGIGKWPFKKDFYLDRRVFVPFVNAAREIKNKNTFQFEADGKDLKLKHGSRKASFISQTEVSGYGNLAKVMKEKKSTFPASSALKELLLCGKNCAVSDSVVPELNCVYVAKSNGALAVEAYAASDKVFYLGTGKIEGKMSKSVPFPLFLINLLNVDGIEEISWFGKYIVVRFERGMIWQPISEEALTSFPLKRIQKHSKSTDALPKSFIVSSRRFSTAMLRLGFYLQAVRRKDWVVKLSGKKGNSTLSITTSIPGSAFVERIDTVDTLRRDVDIEWPLDVLEPVFDFLSKKTKKMALTVRVDAKDHISYIRSGSFWLAVPSKQE